MRWIDKEMERRGEERTRRRLECEIFVGDESHTGIVLEMSLRGILVQSEAMIPCGEKARIRLFDADGETLAQVEGSVTHKCEVPHRLASLTSGTLGLTLSAASRSYFSLCGHRRRPRSPDELFRGHGF